MIGLRVGDVITTEKDIHTPIPVSVEGVVKYHARPGAFKGRKAIEITETVAAPPPKAEPAKPQPAAAAAKPPAANPAAVKPEPPKPQPAAVPKPQPAPAPAKPPGK